MSVLVLGADGMLGSVLVKAFENAHGTTRRTFPTGDILIGDVDVTKTGDLRRALDIAAPWLVINCVAITECGKHSDPQVMEVNAEAPHRIAELTQGHGCRVIHISTDAVFDGSRGNRLESDTPDAVDLYGRSKAAGDLVDYPHCVTLRTSFVGRDRRHRRGILERLLAFDGNVSRHWRSMWSGLSTHEFARAVIIAAAADLPLGLYHVAGPVISKADLLGELARAYGIPSKATQVDDPQIDRTLNGSRFAQAAKYVAPGWTAMAKELARVDP